MGAGSEAPKKGRERQGSDYQLGELDLGLGPSVRPSGVAPASPRIPQLNPDGAPDTAGGSLPLPDLSGAGPSGRPASPPMAIPQLPGAGAEAAAASQLPQMRPPSAQPSAPMAMPQLAPPPARPSGGRAGAGGQRAPADGARLPRLTLSEDDGSGATEFELDHAHGARREPDNDWSGQVHFGATVDSFDDELNPDRGGPDLELEEVNAREARLSRPRTEQQDAEAERRLQHEQARKIAEYPEPPESLLASVPYAARVLARMWPLHRLREKARKEALALEADLREAFVELGEGLMEQAKDPTMAPLGKQIAAVHNAQAKANHAGRSVESQREKVDETLRSLDGELATALKALEPFAQAEKEAATRHKKAQDEVRRAEAMVKRVEIELRALHEASAVQDPLRVQQLEADLERREDSLEQARQAAERTAQALGVARATLARERGTVDAIEERKKQVIDDAKKREEALEAAARDAEGLRAEALVALARKARELGLDRRCRERAEWADDVHGTTAEAKHNAMLHDMAFDSYDRPALLKGGGLALGLLVALLTALIAGPSLWNAEPRPAPAAEAPGAPGP